MMGSAEQGMLIPSPDAQWSSNPVSPPDLSATTINDNNYNSKLHAAASQVTKHTGMYYLISSWLLAGELRLPYVPLHTMEKPRKVK